VRRTADRYGKPGLAPGFFCLLSLAACGDPPGPPAKPESIPARLTQAGRIDVPALDELSGMARSVHDPGRLWVHNDSGDKARLYAISSDGRYQGRLKLDDADNVDWEDLASFSLDGRAYLLVADIGDNDRRRDFVSLYVVSEPDAAEHEAAPDWRIDFRYPDGPRDAEAVAVDAAEGSVYVLTKRDLPPLLYRVPLEPDNDSPVTAERIGAVTTLPRPPQRDVEVATLSKDWHWQPTAMDLAADGTFVVVLTYGGVYYFRRDPGTGVAAALAAPPLRFPLRDLQEAEAVAASADGLHLYITAEGRHPPLLHIEREDRNRP
jgi:hypothetical protein